MGRSPGRRDTSDRKPRGDHRNDRSQRYKSHSRERHRGSHHRHNDDNDRSHERRDRSRDRKRHREASPVKERRHDHAHYRDRDDRDTKRARRQHSPDERQHPRHDSQPRAEFSHFPKSKALPEKHDEKTVSRREQKASDKQAERLARVHAMKQQQGSAGGQGIQVKGIASAAASAATSDNNGNTSRPPSAGTGQARRFDPAVIQERAAAKLAEGKARQLKALGSDIVVPKVSASSAPNPEWQASAASARNSAKPQFRSIGLGKSQQDKSVKVSAKTSAAFADDDDDDDARHDSRKLELLPDMPATLDTTQPAQQDDDDNDEQIVSDDEEDGRNAHALENAQRRAEQAQRSLHDQAQSEHPAYSDARDTDMPDAPEKDENDDEEDDPLDAFMKTLDMPTDQGDILSDVRSGKGRKKLFNADDEDYNDVDPSTLSRGNNNAKKSAKKDVPKVDHSKLDYEDFRKDFYRPSVELAALTEEEVDNIRVELDNTKVKGKDVPAPIQSFGQGGFGAHILDIMKGRQFEAPTSIQAQALPAIMSGRDVIGVAKTGSGKTMAYLLPMFRHVKDQRPVANMEGPISLVIAPTRELALQIFKECKPFLDALGLRGICAIGGSPMQDCINDFKRGGEVCVTTPGRFIDVLASNNGRVTNLRRCTYVVIDEADRMFDMGFEPTVSRILGNIRPSRQTVLFSATFPKSMETLARKYVKNAIEILVGDRSIVAPEIEQIVEVREQKDKLKRTLELLSELHVINDNDDRSLIFVERQESADSLNIALTKRGFLVRAIHGGHDQIDREQWISDFKSGTLPTLVATSVAARGLDVRQLKLVINWDCPNHNEDYVHRCGRTGRAGQKGTAVTYITPEQDQYAPFLVKALKSSKKPIPEELQKLADQFDKKVEAGLAKKFRAGFGGKGVERLTAARDAQRARERKLYVAPEEEVEEEATDKKSATAEDKAKAKDAAALVAAAASGVTARDAPSSPKEDTMNAHLHQLLRDAMVVKKTEAPKPTKDDANESPKIMDKKARLAAAMKNIENRISGKGNARGVSAADKRGPDAGEFSATLQVNDFPQKARWGVTNRSNVAKILEATGTSITTKGNFYAAGTEPGEGDPPKLYILVEGETQIAVETAMRELTERLLAGIEQNQADIANRPAGRYTVI